MDKSWLIHTETVPTYYSYKINIALIPQFLLASCLYASISQSLVQTLHSKALSCIDSWTMPQKQHCLILYYSQHAPYTIFFIQIYTTINESK